MTTKADVIKAAEEVASLEMIENSMGMGNVPTDPVKRVEAQAALSIARNRTTSAREKYNRLFRAWELSDFPE